MTDLTRTQVEEWLRRSEAGILEGALPGNEAALAVPALCRALLEAWGYKAEAMAARRLVRCRFLMAEASHPGGESDMTPDEQEYVRARRASGAAARAANECGEGE